MFIEIIFSKNIPEIWRNTGKTFKAIHSGVLELSLKQNRKVRRIREGAPIEVFKNNLVFF